LGICFKQILMPIVKEHFGICPRSIYSYRCFFLELQKIAMTSIQVPVYTTEFPFKLGQSRNLSLHNFHSDNARIQRANVDLMIAAESIVDIGEFNTLEVHVSTLLEGLVTATCTGNISLTSSNTVSGAIALASSGVGGGITLSAQLGGITATTAALGEISLNSASDSNLTSTLGAVLISSDDVSALNGQVHLRSRAARNDAILIEAAGASNSDGISLAAYNTATPLIPGAILTLLATGTSTLSTSAAAAVLDIVSSGAAGVINIVAGTGSGTLTMTSAGVATLSGAGAVTVESTAASLTLLGNTGITVSANGAGANPVVVQALGGNAGSTVSLISTSSAATAITLTATTSTGGISQTCNGIFLLNSVAGGQMKIACGVAAPAGAVDTLTVRAGAGVDMGTAAGNILITSIANKSGLSTVTGGIVHRYTGGFVKQSANVAYAPSAATVVALASDVQGGIVTFTTAGGAASTMEFPTAALLAATILGGAALAGDSLSFILINAQASAQPLILSAGVGVTLGTFSFNNATGLAAGSQRVVTCVFTSPTAYTVYA
jgi:fibronectin-binding autotransporter adhesin